MQYEEDDNGLSDLNQAGIVVPIEEVQRAPLLKIKVVEGPEISKN